MRFLLVLLDFCLFSVPGTQSWQVDSSVWCGVTAIYQNKYTTNQMPRLILAINSTCIYRHLLGFSVDTAWNVTAVRVWVTCNES